MKTIQTMFFTAALAIPLVGGFDVSTSTAATLSADEIKAVIVGKTFTYWGKSKGKVKWTRTTVRYWGDDKWGADKGKWWLDGNKYCRQYPGQKAKCGRFKSNSDGSYSATSGYKMKPL